MATEIAVEEEIAPENIPLPTDSMVTVRLSDAIFQSEIFAQDDLEETHEVEQPPLQKCQSASEVYSSRPSSASSRRSELSSGSNSVDWEELEKTEEQEPKDECTDESTALLLARLEQENNAIAKDPKAGIAATRQRTDTRPPSIHQLKKLVNGPQRQSLRYSLLPAPPMTELEFWAALVQDYPQTAQRLPTLTSNKIRGGVPPPLRGVVWPAIAGAQDAKLHEEFQRLSVETSPYDGLIGKDVGRSFPNVDMFREKDGEGQQMLRRVLKAFSLFDEKIGYCQGLGFVVGPLLMHMSEPEAFSVLVRLMDHYDLRTCYTPDLAGLHLRIYQFQALLTKHLPTLAARLAELNIEPLYVSQWFLSFFAVTCPLPMLLRIYDIILAEGATETLMRVALSLMQRNEKKLHAFHEFEEVMQFLLSRSLWDTYAQQADDMVTDFVSLTNLVSRESLHNLETEFKASQTLAAPSMLRTAAASLLGRFWAGSSHTASKSGNVSLAIPIGSLRKVSSGNSLTTTVASVETIASEPSTAPTEISETDRIKSQAVSFTSDAASTTATQSSDRDLHNQIEELLTAMSKLQHHQLEIARDLQREREEREEERVLATTIVHRFKKQRSAMKELLGEEIEPSEDDLELDELLDKAGQIFSPTESRRVSIIQTKHQLRDAAAEWKEKADAEAARCQDLMRRLDERDAEHNSLKESLKDARQRVQDAHREKQRLERSVQDLKSRSSTIPDSPSDVYTPISEKAEIELRLPTPKKGLREFRLGKSEAPRPASIQFSKRTSSLQTQMVVATDGQQTQSPESLLLELVNAKTAEAVARQELEETKSKLDALRKIISGGSISPNPPSRTVSGSDAGTPPAATTPAATPAVDTPKPVSHAPSTSIGGFFSGWGKKSHTT